MLRLLPGVLLLVVAVSLQAGEVEYSRVAHDGGRYSLDITLRIQGELPAIHSIVTRYGELYRLSDVIRESRLLETAEGEPVRRFYVTQTCILFFCFQATVVEDITETADGTILTSYVTDLSDFSYGITKWRVTAADPGYTLIRFSGEFRPDFWIPPVIGPYFIKRKMLNAAEQTIRKIESIAASEEIRP